MRIAAWLMLIILALSTGCNAINDPQADSETGRSRVETPRVADDGRESSESTGTVIIPPPSKDRDGPERTPLPHPTIFTAPPSGTPRALTVLQAFTGQGRSGHYASVSVGKHVVIALSYTEVALFDKDSRPIERVAIVDFFSAILPTGEGTTDPRTGYDPHSGRFFVVAASAPSQGDPNCGICSAHLLIGVSNSDSPSRLDGTQWTFHLIDAKIEHGERTPWFADYNIFGFSADLMVISAQVVDHDPLPRAVHPRLWVFNRTEALDGRGLSRPLQEFTNLVDPRSGEALTFRVLPADQLDEAGGIYFVYSQANCDVVVGKITGRPENAEVRLATVHVESRDCGGSVLARQMSDLRPLRTTGHIASPPIYTRGNLWIAQLERANGGAGGETGVRILHIDVSDWPSPPRIVEDLTIWEAGTAYSAPAIAANPQGDVAVTFNRVNETSYMSAWYAGRLADDPSGDFRPPVPFGLGKAIHAPTDSPSDVILMPAYNGAAVDPSDGSAWFLTEWADAPCSYALQLAHIQFVEGGTATPPPEASPDERTCP